MVNERLRRAMLGNGLTAEGLAEAVGVSTKTVERWVLGHALPYPVSRFKVAAAVGQDEAYLWPETVNKTSLAGAELVATYPRRADVPSTLWIDLLKQADRNVDLLAFAGLFLTEEHPDWLPLLRTRADNGVRVRLLVGDPEGQQLVARDAEYRIGGGVTGRTRAVLSHYDPLRDVVEIRVHDTPLYNSIYRFDDEMLVNTHVYGILAAFTPTLHLRRVDGQFYSTYLESYERVWASARPVDELLAP